MSEKPIDQMTADELERAIEYHDYQYWVLHAPVIADERYDLLTRRLESLRPDSSVLGRVGGGFATETFRNKVEHATPMLSLDKCYDDAKFNMWLKATGRAIRTAMQEEPGVLPARYLPFAGAATDDALLVLARELPVTASPKIDGVAAALRYDDQGTLVQAATRGDGARGEDFTVNARLIQGIPWQLPRGPVEVRGEVYMTRSIFQARYRDRFPNPRNLTAGTLKQKESNRSQLLDLSFFAYDLLADGPASETEKRSLLAESGFVPVPAKSVVAGEASAHFTQALADRDCWDFDADGLVVRLVDVALQRVLGATAHHPRYAIAFKFQGDAGLTTLNDVEWSVSRNGTITPVALVEPVFLSGAQVARSTLHNIQEFSKLELHRGDQVQLKRRGDVIPKVEGNLGGGEEPFFVPRFCPSCGAETLLAAPQLFVSGYRLGRFADTEQLVALIDRQKRVAGQIGLLSLLDTHNSVARRTGDLRFKEQLTWGRGERDIRPQKTRLLNALPTLRYRYPELLLTLVFDPTLEASRAVLARVVPLVKCDKLALKLLVVPHSRLEGTEPEEWQRWIHAGRNGAFFATLAEEIPEVAAGLAGELRAEEGEWDETFRATVLECAYALSEDVLSCSEPATCPQVVTGGLEHFIQTLGVDGFGRKIIDSLYRARLLRGPADFFRLTVADLEALERMGELLAAKLVGNVQSARETTLASFLQALGIDELARHVSTILEREVGELDGVLALTESDLETFESIAFGIAHQVVHGLRRARPVIDSLRPYVTLTTPAAEPMASGAPFGGQSFVFTGKLKGMSRKEAQAMVKELGGETPSGVTTDLAFLVVGDEGSPLFGEGTKGSKMKKAEKYNEKGATIEIISETRFLEMVEQARGE